MPYPKGKPHSAATKAKMRTAHAGRTGHPQSNETRAKISAKRSGRFALHGLSEHPLYRTWANMISRCENPSDRAYSRYGGRGIKVCDRWHDVRLFVADIEGLLGACPAGNSLDRKDNEGNYEPGNVRWATAAEQAANRRKRKRRSETIYAGVLALIAGGYVGESTRSEIEYAVAHGKPVRYLEPLAEAYELGENPESGT